MFRRRIPTPRLQRLREFFWPRRGFWRTILYYSKRLMRLKATPHAVAAGFASGAYVSFLPLPGLHFILAALMAIATRGNVLASAIGTAVGNPLTFPFMWGAAFKMGEIVLGPAGGSPRQFLRTWEWSKLYPIMEHMILGGLIVGILPSLAFYFLVRWSVAGWQRRRQAKMEQRSRKTAETEVAE